MRGSHGVLLPEGPFSGWDRLAADDAPTFVVQDDSAQLPQSPRPGGDLSAI